MINSMTVMPNRVIFQCLLCCLLFPACPADRSSDGEPLLLEGTCQDVDVPIARNVSTGVQVILAPSTDNINEPPLVNYTIAGRYLPPECSTNHQVCGILQFRHSSGTSSHFIIPLIGGFVMLSCSVEYVSNRTETSPRKEFFNVTENCNPTKAFLAGHNRIIVACMDLQSRPHGMLYYLQYQFHPDSTGMGGSIVRSSNLQTALDTIYDPKSVSEILYVCGQSECADSCNLYVIDEGYVLAFPASNDVDPEFRAVDITNQLRQCVDHQYQSFEYYGNEDLIIRCLDGRTALYSSCSTGRFTYPPSDRVPYPCTSWSNAVAYRNGTKLSLEKDGQVLAERLLPFDDLSFGKCVQRSNSEYPIFIATTSNGSIFVAPFDGSNLTEISSSGSCFTDNTACPSPMFTEDERAFGTFDSITGNFVVVNVSVGCSDEPIVARLTVPLAPRDKFLVSLTLGQGTHNCHCQSSEPNTSSPPLPHVTQTESPTTNHDKFTKPATSTSPTAVDTSSATKSFTTSISENTDSTHQTISSPLPLTHIIPPVLVPFSVLAVSVTVIILLLVYCLCCHTKRKTDYPPNVLSVQESELQCLNKGTGQCGVDQCTNGGCESDRTSTTTSFLGYDETASSNDGESQPQAVPIRPHSESGQEGAATCPLSKDVLPLHHTRLSPDQLCQQYQSRNADNRDKDDMDKKVYGFMVEDNNSHS